MGLPDQFRAAWQRDRSACLRSLLVLALPLLLYTRGLGWGLPAGDETWAADAIRPSAPLAVAYHNFLGHGFNGGWFWFKYPPFHAFVLVAAYLPFLAFLWLTGGLTGLRSDYPFGLADPVSSLTTLALLGRATSAAMGLGCVLLARACVARSFGPSAGTFAALLTAVSYPMVFYAQTTNVEVPYLFWLMSALLAAVRIVEGETGRRWWVLLGIGAALSVSTKELAAGAFVGMPLAIVASKVAARRPAGEWIRGGLVAGLAFTAAMVVANNAWFNPLGFERRIGFLTQTLPEEIALQYAPYYFPIDLGGARDAGVESAQLAITGRRIVESLGWPVLALAFAGIAVAMRRRPAWSLLLLACAVTFYLVSVRAMLNLSVRYVLPLTVLCCVFAGIALAALSAEGRAAPARRALAALFVAWAFAYGWDVNRMLTGDGRYGAESWLASAPAGTTVEIYQNRTYLPRFPEGLDIREIPFEERTVEAFASRRPDLVVLSSAGLSGVAVQYKEDWQDDDGEAAEGYTPAKRTAAGDVMSFTRDANARFLEDLTSGRLGYEAAAEFVVQPWIERPLIQSLNPRITIYRRIESAPDAAGRDGTETRNQDR